MTIVDEGRALAREALRAREQALLALPLRAPHEVVLCVVADGGSVAGSVDGVSAVIVAIDLEHVIEVVPFAATIAIADPPPFHLGLLRLGADVVPVLDLATRFGAGEARRRLPDLSELIVIVRADDRPLGIVVAAIRGVVTTGRPTVDAPAGPWSDCLLGVFLVDGGPVGWLEPATLARTAGATGAPA